MARYVTFSFLYCLQNLVTFNKHNISQFELATFSVLNSHKGLMVIILGSEGLWDTWWWYPFITSINHLSLSFLINQDRDLSVLLTFSKNQLWFNARKIMLKILQARLEQYMNWEPADVQVDLKKSKEPEIKLPISVGSYKKQENSKKSTSASLSMLKPLAVRITTNCGKFLRDGNTRPP